MINLSVNIAGVEFKNPIITASGTFGFGKEYEEFYKLSELGGISLKGLTLEKRNGNPAPRICETPSGMLNSVGLQNPGVEGFIKNDLPYLKDKNTVLIANLAGSSLETYIEGAKLLSKSDVDMVELNISCPNVKEGGVAFGVSCESTYNITKEVRKHCTKPLIVKLSPNVTDIASIAKSAEDAGADAISLINTLLGMQIDTKTRKPILKNNVGGLSGPAVFPVALRMVWQVANAVKIPVIGMGGVSSANDALQMIMAGATAVQVGTSMFSDPYSPVKIVEGIKDFLEKENIDDINKLIKTVEIW